MTRLKLLEASKAMCGEVIGGRDVFIKSITTDSRSASTGSLFFAISGNNFDGHDYVMDAFEQGAKIAVVHRDLMSAIPAGKSVIKVQDTLTALQDLAAYHRKKFKNLKLVGVTGSNGKTTVKEMVALVLGKKFRTLKTEGNLNNHIGTPLTLLRLNESHEAAVIEMGTNAPGEIKRLANISMPSIGVITNIAAAHLQGLGSIASIRKEKGDLLYSLGPRGVAILNIDDENSAELVKKIAGRTVTYGSDSKATVQLVDSWPNGFGGRNMVVYHKGHEHEIHQPLPGYHNVANAMAATAVGFVAGVGVDGIRGGLNKIKTSPMRMVISKLANGATFINDAYNANTSSVEAALATVVELGIRGKFYFAFGGMLELGNKSEVEHKKVARIAKKYGVTRLFALGKLSRVTALEAKKINLACDKRGSHFTLAKVIANNIGPEDTILIKGSRGTKMELVEKHLNEMIGGGL